MSELENGLNAVMKLQSFAPEVVVEATGTCDRACHGCYAPNLMTKLDPKELMVASPRLFLKPERLQVLLEEITKEIGRNLSRVSVRGGEPTRHPNLDDILRITSQFSEQVYLA